MKGFIEVTEKEHGVKILIFLNRVISISRSDEDNTAFIELSIDSNGESVGFNTLENYDSVVQKVKDFA